MFVPLTSHSVERAMLNVQAGTAAILQKWTPRIDHGVQLFCLIMPPGMTANQPGPIISRCGGGQDAEASQAAAEALLEEVKAAWEEREAEDADLRSRLQAREDQVPAIRV